MSDPTMALAIASIVIALLTFISSHIGVRTKAPHQEVVNIKEKIWQLELALKDCEKHRANLIQQLTDAKVQLARLTAENGYLLRELGQGRE